MAFYWSQHNDPNDWKPSGRSVWCPKWAQRIWMWYLRRRGYHVIGVPGSWTAFK
jgi:hypothetical protein